MEDFFFKLNRECFLLIDGKLNDRNLNPEDCDPYMFFDWVENAAKLKKIFKYNQDQEFTSSNETYCFSGSSVSTVYNPLPKREIAMTTGISYIYKGKFNWFNAEKTILDLGGCENLVNSAFANNHLKLDIQTDTSTASCDIQRSVNGDTFHFSSFVEINCNFNGHREKVRFYLMDNLPLPFLLGYPFLLKKGAIFDLKASTVVLSNVESKPNLTIIPTPSTDNNSAFVFDFSEGSFTHINSAFYNSPYNTEKLYNEFCSIFLSDYSSFRNLSEEDNSGRKNFAQTTASRPGGQFEFLYKRTIHSPAPTGFRQGEVLCPDTIFAVIKPRYRPLRGTTEN